MDFHGILWRFPLMDTIQFVGVHAYLIPSYNYPQILNFVFGKLALGGF
jgi:hypothetical protein